MKPLAKEYRKNGYDYKLVRRTAYAAMFSQHDEDGRFVSYEVGRVKSDNGGTFAGLTIEPGERFWSNEDFGVIAKTTASEVQAEIYFNQFHEAGVEVANNTPAK